VIKKLPVGNWFYFSQLEPNPRPVKRACARNPDIVMRERRRTGNVRVHALHPRFVVDYIKGLSYNFTWCCGKKSAPGVRCRTRRVRHHERHGKDERREKDECNGKANGEQRRRPAAGIVLAKRSHVAEAQQVRISSFVSHTKGAVHSSAGPCIFPCYLLGRLYCTREPCGPRRSNAESQLRRSRRAGDRGSAPRRPACPPRPRSAASSSSS
jgi:hypothetical protein